MHGFAPPSRLSLPRVQDRLTFLYLEHCVVHRDANALTARDQMGVVNIPTAAVSCILFGPGTTVSHQAIVVMAECGVSSVWVGESGVRYYAHGRSLAYSTTLLVAQARLVSNERERLKVARRMYELRFPGEDVSGLTMRQLRGREGARMREVYRENSQRTGVEWKARKYDPNDFEASDLINQALSAANYSLYGVIHAVIVALGCSPGLGFVHSSNAGSFVYDIADLYKAQISIPAAFDVIAEGDNEVGARSRRKVRDLLFDQKVIQRAVFDIKNLLGADEVSEEELSTNVLTLWDIREGAIDARQNYAGA